MATGFTKRELDDATTDFGVLRPTPPMVDGNDRVVTVASFGVSLTDREILLRFVGANGETGDVAIGPVVAARLIQMLTRTGRTLDWFDDEGVPIPCSTVLSMASDRRTRQKA